MLSVGDYESSYSLSMLTRKEVRSVISCFFLVKEKITTF